MSRSARIKRQRRTQATRLRWRTLRMTAILSFLCLAICAVGLSIAANAQVALGQSTPTASACQLTLITTNQGQPAKWYSIHTGSAADILSAVKCTDMFQCSIHGTDLIASALQRGTLATPVLVKPYRSDAGLAQFWVVPVVDQNRYPLALLTFFYEPQARLIQEGEFDAVTNDMFYVHHVFPAVTPQRAIAVVQTKQHVAAVQGRMPELVYFPGNFADVKAGGHSWNAGGTTVIDPLWRVPGADGKWHYVDHNGGAHLNTELPVDPTYLPAPSTTAIP